MPADYFVYRRVFSADMLRRSSEIRHSNGRGKLQKGGENTAHEVNIADGSLLAKIVDAKKIETNSSHLKAISSKFCGNCIITARANDGTVEAIELKNPWNKFVLGVQWHPEFFCKKNDVPSLNIFKSFISHVFVNFAMPTKHLINCSQHVLRLENSWFTCSKFRYLSEVLSRDHEGIFKCKYKACTF